MKPQASQCDAEAHDYGGDHQLRRRPRWRAHPEHTPVTEAQIAWGDTFFYYAPDGVVPSATQPFATIVTKNYPGDETSRLDRPDVFRVNMAAGREEFIAHVVGLLVMRTPRRAPMCLVPTRWMR